MNKPLTLYLALTAAVDDYNQRHDLKRAVLADEIGYIGANAARCFSNDLNPLNDKLFNDEKKTRLLHAMDMQAVKVFFDSWGREFGLRAEWIIEPDHIKAVNATSVDMRDIIGDAQAEANDVYNAHRTAMADGVMTIEEIKHIRKEATESMRAAERTVAACDIHIARIKGGYYEEVSNG